MSVAERTPFIGRQRELDLALAEIGGGARALSLSGPSGVGKTRLANQLLREITRDFPEFEILSCSAAAARSVTDLEAAIAAALKIPHKQGSELIQAARNRGAVLFLLDNLDSLGQNAREFLQEWIDGAPQLQLVLTSIIPVGLEGESQLEVGPLELEDATKLYRERANKVWVGKAFSQAEERAIEELVLGLDCLPLAIELAAARVRTLPPRALLTRLDERFEILRSSVIGGGRSLLRALQVTWDLLTPEERRFLSKASVFSGGFTLAAAEALLSEAGERGPSVLELLDGLRSKALVQIEEREEPRFSLYESVQEFASRHLQEDLEEEAFLEHASYFIRVGSEHLIKSEGAEPRSSLRWLRDERENLLSAHLRHVERHPRLAAEAGLILAAIHKRQAPPASELELLDSTVAAARAGAPDLLWRALRSRADALARFGKNELGRADVVEGLHLAAESGDRVAEATHLSQLAFIDMVAGNLEGSAASLDRAQPMATALGLKDLEAQCCLRRVQLSGLQEGFGPDDPYLQRGLSLSREHGLLDLRAFFLLALNVALAKSERYEEARLVLQEIDEIVEALEDETLEAHVLLNRGGLEITAGRPEEAKAFLQEALEKERRLGNRIYEATALGNLGLGRLQLGEPEAAVKELLAAKAIYAEFGHHGFMGDMAWFASIAHSWLGDGTAAQRYLREAEQAWERASSSQTPAKRSIAEAFLQLSPWISGSAEGPAAPAAASQARAALPEATGFTLENLLVGRRLLEGALRMVDEPPRESNEAPVLLSIARDATWFEIGGAARVDLRRRGAIRRILLALLEQHLRDPAVGLGREKLFDEGWRGEKSRPDAAAARVYVSVGVLRSLGLESVLVRHSDGYLLDPAATIHVVEP